MSMSRCDKCSCLVDTDEDVECYDQEGQCTCESCREQTEQDAIAEHIGVTNTAAVAYVQSLTRQLMADAHKRYGERPQKVALEYQIWDRFGPSWRVNVYFGDRKPSHYVEAATAQDAIRKCLAEIQQAPDLHAILGLEVA